MILLWLLVGAIPGRAAVTPREVRSAGELEAAKALAAPRAFVRGDNVRIYYTNETGQRVTFVADWKPSHLQAQGFRYHQAVLKYDRTPPKLPKPDSAWAEAIVLDRKVWNELAETAREELAPSAVETGFYFQTYLGEG